jgi:hypothetical protein
MDSVCDRRKQSEKNVLNEDKVAKKILMPFNKLHYTTESRRVVYCECMRNYSFHTSVCVAKCIYML